MSTAPSEADELVALSGLQHLVFCERQAALIHVERVWMENVATTEGNILHERSRARASGSRSTSAAS